MKKSWNNLKLSELAAGGKLCLARVIASLLLVLAMLFAERRMDIPGVIPLLVLLGGVYAAWRLLTVIERDYTDPDDAEDDGEP